MTANDLLLGLALGFSLAVPPGPMNAWIAAASARSYRSGVATGAGAASADAVLGAAVYLVERAVALERYLPVVYVLGAVAMAYFAYRLLRRTASGEPPESRLRSYSQAFALGLSNPYQVVWWLTAGVAFAYVGGAVLLAGLFAALAVWVAGFPAVVRRGARGSDRVQRYVKLTCGGAMAAFATYFAYRAIAG